MREPKPDSRRRSHTEHRSRKDAAGAAFEQITPADQQTIMNLQGRALRRLQMANPKGRVGNEVANDFIQALAHKLAQITPE